MLSSYNHYKKIDDEVIIYNSLSDKLEKITEQDFVNLTETRCDANISDEILTRLYKNDMLVDKYQDESAKTIHRYNKATFSNQLHIVLLVTTDCNFSCNYCYQDYDKMYINSTFIDAFSKFIENNIMKYDGVYIEWFGGEPLLMRKKVIELSTKIQDICKSNNIPYIGTITTNGFYLDEKTALNLIKSGIKFFQVTLDGDEQSHNVLRKSKNGKGSYDRITTNLINIKQNLPSNLFFRIGVRNNVSKFNINNSSYPFFKENLDGDKRFSYFQFPIKNWGGTQIESIKDDLIDDDADLIDTDEASNFSRPYSRRLCYVSKNNGFAVTPDLKVYKCHHFVGSYYIPKLNMMNLFGEISKNGIIMSNEGAEVDWSYVNLDEECKKCCYLPNCLFDRCPLRKIEPTEICKKQQKKIIQNKLSNLCNR